MNWGSTPYSSLLNLFHLTALLIVLLSSIMLYVGNVLAISNIVIYPIVRLREDKKRMRGPLMAEANIPPKLPFPRICSVY